MGKMFTNYISGMFCILLVLSSCALKKRNKSNEHAEVQIALITIQERAGYVYDKIGPVSINYLTPKENDLTYMNLFNTFSQLSPEGLIKATTEEEVAHKISFEYFTKDISHQNDVPLYTNTSSSYFNGVVYHNRKKTGSITNRYKVNYTYYRVEVWEKSSALLQKQVVYVEPTNIRGKYLDRNAILERLYSHLQDSAGTYRLMRAFKKVEKIKKCSFFVSWFKDKCTKKEIVPYFLLKQSKTQ